MVLSGCSKSIEKIIREKYQVAKEGEKMVTIVEENRKDLSISVDEKVKHGFIEWFKSIFKK